MAGVTIKGMVFTNFVPTKGMVVTIVVPTKEMVFTIIVFVPIKDIVMLYVR